MSATEPRPDGADGADGAVGAVGAAGAALEALTKVWSTRPHSEVAEFAGSLDPGPGKDSRSVLTHGLEQARAVGAVSGSVRPADLVAAEGDVVRGGDLLAAIAAEFDRAVVAGRMTWTLRSHSRSTTLSRLFHDREGLAEALRRAAAVPTDSAGDVLRRLLARLADPVAPAVDGPLPADVVGGAESAAVSQALLWASEVGDLSASIAWATCRAHYEAILGSYRGLLAHGLVGRDDERRTIEGFVDAPSDPSSPYAPVLTLSGIGGAGKSTLLADVFRPRLEALLAGAGSPAVVVIDLDRVAFRPHAEVELSYEVTRQLEVAWPELAQELAEARASETQSRLERREFAVGASPDAETSSRSTASFESRIWGLVTGSDRGREPVVLVLDTFEEWQRARPYAFGPRSNWNDPEPVMAEWITGLRHTMGLAGLRVVVSGRAKFGALPGVHVDLPELGADSAAYLLVGLGVPEQIAPRLAAMVGGNPLSLHVAARFVGRLSPDERTDFLAGGELDPALDEELRRAVLYDRFLEHIGDTQVQRLAHPGLALRRVTPELVREVLALPCGFEDMSVEESERLVDRLADEVWLVRRAEDDSLRHQPEVRRAMLALMSRDPGMREKVRSIHEGAAAWYNPSPDPSDEPTVGNVEAFYHRMMLSTGDPPVYQGDWDPTGRPPTDRRVGNEPGGPRRAHERQRAQLLRFAQQLGESVSEMAPAVEAQLRLVRGDRLTRVQAALLPDYLWEGYVETQGRALLAGGTAEAAVELFLTREWARGKSVPLWLAQAFCESAQWEEYCARKGFGAHGRHDLVNRVVSGDPEALAPLTGSASVDSSDPAEAFLHTFAIALARARRGLDPGEVSAPGFGESLPSNPLFPVDQLRRYVVHRLTGAPLRLGGGASVFPDFAGLFVPDPKVMAAYANLTIDQPRLFLEFSRELAELAEHARGSHPSGPAGPRAHDLLGEFASMVSKRLGSTTRLSQGPLDELSLLALRGDNPELRPAIRHELLAAAPDEDWLRTMGEVATQLLPVPVIDLRPEALPLLSEPVARTALLTLVEYVDRSRCTRAFLGALQERHPEPHRLDRITAAFVRWDDAHLRLLEDLGRRTRA